MKVNSIDEILANGPGEYEIPYNYNGHTFYFNVKVGDVDSSASLNWNGYGSGVSSDGKFYDKYLENHDTNSIDVRFSYSDDGYKYGGYPEASSAFLGELSNAFNLDSSNTLISGFSSTAHRAIGIGVAYARDTGASGFNILVTEDVHDYRALYPNQRQILIDHDVTIINAYARPGCNLLANPYSNYTVDQYMLDSYKGVHVVDLRFVVRDADGRNISDKAHTTPHDILALYGITNLENGSFDYTQLPTEYHDRNFGDVTIEYVVTEHYMNEDGQYVARPLTLEELNEVFGCGPY
jgi:hypothetical protein